MPVSINEIINDVTVAPDAVVGTAAAAANGPPGAAQPSPPELDRAQALAAARYRSAARTAVEPRRRAGGDHRA